MGRAQRGKQKASTQMREFWRRMNTIKKIKQNNVIMPARAILEWMIIPIELTFELSPE